MNNLGTRAIEAGGKLTVKSALNPLLWSCGVVSVPFLIIFTSILLTGKSIPEWILVGIFVLIALPIIVTMICALFLLFFDRDKLQSEDYQIRKRSLELVEQKGEPAYILADSVVTVSKPNTKIIPKKLKSLRIK